MKIKFILLALIILFISACETTVKSEFISDKIDGNSVMVLTIDTCEYIYIGQGNATWGSHKGNSKYCEKRNRDYIDTTIKKYFEIYFKRDSI